MGLGSACVTPHTHTYTVANLLHEPQLRGRADHLYPPPATPDKCTAESGETGAVTCPLRVPLHSGRRAVSKDLCGLISVGEIRRTHSSAIYSAVTVRMALSPRPWYPSF